MLENKANSSDQASLWNGKNLRFALVVAQFNSLITDQLRQGAIQALKQAGVADKDIQVYLVPGAFEIPLVAQKIAEKKLFDAVLCLGAVIRGQTTHYDYVCQQCASGVAQVSLKTNTPCLFGVLTCENMEQALHRCGVKTSNKGYDTALAAIQTVRTLEQI